MLERMADGRIRCFVERDDQCAILTRGNKVRKLEFLLGRALRRNAGLPPFHLFHPGTMESVCNIVCPLLVRAG